MNWVDKRLALSMLAVLGAVLVDNVAGPILLHRCVDLRFAVGVVVIVGMRDGPWRGLAAGWFAGLVLAALLGEHLGQSMLTLGVAGFLAGHTERVVVLTMPVLDTLVLLGLLLGEQILGDAVAVAALGTHAELGLGGILLTTATLGVFLWSHPPGAGKKHAQAWPPPPGAPRAIASRSRD